MAPRSDFEPFDATPVTIVNASTGEEREVPRSIANFKIALGNWSDPAEERAKARAAADRAAEREAAKAAENKKGS